MHNTSFIATPFLANQTLPIRVLAPNLGLDDVCQWLSSHKTILDDLTHEAGVVLIRDLPINTPLDFKSICEAIHPSLKSYVGGDSPRNELADKVYTSTEYESDLEVLLHNELSYAGWSPNRVFFGCLKASETGGETHLADGRRVYNKLNTEVRQRFESKGVIYLQHLKHEGTQGPGKSWQETFETKNQSKAEDYLRNSGMDFEWTTLGIRTEAPHAAILTHSITGEKCWHNQVDQWHRDMPSVKDSVGDKDPTLSKSAGVNELGNHAIFGDRTEIDIHDLHHVRDVCAQCEVKFPWEQGDVMVIDNVLAMHGRKPFKGERQIVVAMA